MIPGLLTATGLLAVGWAVHGAVLHRRLGTARRDPVTGLPVAPRADGRMPGPPAHPRPNGAAADAPAGAAGWGEPS